MQMVSDTKTHEKFWKLYENTPNAQWTFFGTHSTRTESLNNMPNGKLLNLFNGSIAITSDGVAFIWDKVLQEWIQQ